MLTAIALLLAILLGVKILMSGWYLTSSAFKVQGPALAMAEEKDTADKTAPLLEEKLRQKEAALDAREKHVKKEETELHALQAKIDNRMSELNDLQTKLTNFARKLAEKEQTMKDSQMNHLVAMYTSMDPGKAAAIMDKLNIKTVVRILKYMKGKNAGQIMDMMPPDRGASISEALSKTN